MKKLIYIFLGLSLMFACSDDGDNDSNEPCPNQPQLTTNQVSEIEYDENTNLTNATFSGEIQNIQLGANCETFSITNQGFVYSTTLQPTTSDNVVNVNGQNPSINIANLSNGTTYYVRAYLTNILGTFYGNEVSFTIPLTPITDANFNLAIETCLSTNPVDGMCSESEYGAMPDWDVSQITDMNQAFYNKADFNADISNWDVSNVTTMSSMFNYNSITPSSFNQPIGDWDVSNVTNMEMMFISTSFNQPIGDWDVSSVTNMHEMFNNAVSFNQPIGDWDVSSVTDMSWMFRSTPLFNQPIGDWDVSNVNNMSWMFYDTSDFNQPLNAWDVSNVNNMFYMFANSASFNQPIGDWDVDSVAQCDGFCSNTPNWTLSKPNFTNCESGCD